MKKIIVSLLALSTIIISAQAQTRRNNENALPDSAHNSQHIKKGGNRMAAEKLGLTDNQKQQMKAIGLDMKSKMADLKNSNLTTEEFNTKKEVLMQERKQKIAALLTPEQKEKMKQFRKERPKQRKTDAAKRMDKIKERLALSDEQVSKMKAQKEAYASKMEAVKNNQSLSDEDKKAQLKALHAERKSNFRSILTPDQAKKMEELKQKRAGKAA